MAAAPAPPLWVLALSMQAAQAQEGPEVRMAGNTMRDINSSTRLRREYWLCHGSAYRTWYVCRQARKCRSPVSVAV